MLNSAVQDLGMTNGDEVSDSAEASLPLTEQDLRDLAFIGASPSHLKGLKHAHQHLTKDQIAHAVFEAGVAKVKEDALEAGYAALAQDKEYARYGEARRRSARRLRQPA